MHWIFILTCLFGPQTFWNGANSTFSKMEKGWGGGGVLVSQISRCKKSILKPGWYPCYNSTRKYIGRVKRFLLSVFCLIKCYHLLQNQTPCSKDNMDIIKTPLSKISDMKEIIRSLIYFPNYCFTATRSIIQSLFVF